jgi:hypothetical protein
MNDIFLNRLKTKGAFLRNAKKWQKQFSTERHILTGCLWYEFIEQPKHDFSVTSGLHLKYTIAASKEAGELFAGVGSAPY